MSRGALHARRPEMRPRVPAATLASGRAGPSRVAGASPRGAARDSSPGARTRPASPPGSPSLHHDFAHLPLRAEAPGAGAPRGRAAPLPVVPVRIGALQRKATVTAPRDAPEVNADALADAALRPDGTVAAPRRSGDAGGAPLAPGTEAALRQLGPGRELPPATRARFERRFGFDFSRVRVHADGEGADLAHDLRARAFTAGDRIAFAAREYAPGTSAGDRLLAHELAHVVQQSHGGSAAPEPSGAPLLQRQEQQGWWARNVSARYAALKESAYKGLIDAARAVLRKTLAGLRAAAVRLLPARALPAAESLIRLVDFNVGLLFAFLYAVIGILVGFGEGIVDVVKGLLVLVYGVIDLLVRLLYGFIDNGEAFDQRAGEIVAALKGMPAALKSLLDDWLERFKTASSERQSLMIGELTGQVLALILTFEVAAAKAGQLPKLTVVVPRVAVTTGGTSVVTGAAVPVSVGAPVAAGGLVGTGALMVQGAEGGGRTPREFPRKTLRGVSLRWLRRNKPRGWREVPTREHEGWIWLDEAGTERLRFMRPTGTNPGAAKWSRQASGYFRWQNEAGELLDVDGKVVARGAPDFEARTHIIYDGPPD